MGPNISNRYLGIVHVIFLPFTDASNLHFFKHVTMFEEFISIPSISDVNLVS